MPNRRMFDSDFLKSCVHTRGNRFTLLLIDVDKFKAVNDRFGHDAGDAFLAETAQRLLTAVRSTDTVARLGGDEFAIIIKRNQSDADIEKLCARISVSFSQAMVFKGEEILTGVSIGIASFPEHGETQESLYKSADLALYEAKRLGRSLWCRYRPELSKADCRTV